jgi:hypothetical protein
MHTEAYPIMSPAHPVMGPSTDSHEYLASDPLPSVAPMPEMVSATATTPRASSIGTFDPVPHVSSPAGLRAPSGHVTASSSTLAPSASAQPAVAPTIAPTSTSVSVLALAPRTGYSRDQEA